MHQDKDEQYYKWVRHELIDLVSNSKTNKILDIGCGEGETGQELKRIGKASEVVGVELIEEVANRAKSKLDKVFVGNIENIKLPYPKGYFDYIIMGDVIEHLLDPWQCLKRLREYLKQDGNLIASIPNINYWRVLKDLVFKDKWEYVKAGTLDNTHSDFSLREAL